ncbi:MAG: thermonuclease family protein [Spirochaetes bacterium]|nr:thermonuclease family protein [Spirochaetota bacterium]
MRTYGSVGALGRQLPNSTRPELDTKKGKDATAFIEKELKDANLIVETRKKEKYGRFLAYVYYYKESKNFEDIIRKGKLLNDELIKAGFAKRYDKKIV